MEFFYTQHNRDISEAANVARHSIHFPNAHFSGRFQLIVIPSFSGADSQDYEYIPPEENMVPSLPKSSDELSEGGELGESHNSV